MAHYTKHPIHLTDSQAKALAHAVSKHAAHSIKLPHTAISGTGNMEVMLTKTQKNKLMKAHSNGVGTTLHFSAAQMKKMDEMQRGGFLPALAGLLPILGEVASIVGPALLGGAAAGLGSWGVNEIADKIAGNGLYTLGNPGTYGAGHPHWYNLQPRNMPQMGYGYAQMGNVGYPHVMAPVGAYDLLPPHQYDAPLNLPAEVFHQTKPINSKFVDSVTPAGVPVTKPKSKKKAQKKAMEVI